MRKSFLIAWFAILSNLAFSQVNVYHPFPTDTAVWLEDVQDQSCHGYCYSIRITQMGDTAINAVQYKKLYQQTGTYSMIGSSGPPMYTPVFAFNPTGSINYNGALRQDLLEKKVYYFPPSGMNHDTLIYDFDLQLGDTLPPTYLFNGMPAASGTNPSKVLRIDSILIDATYRKTFIFDTSSMSQQYTYLIEGVGTSWGPLSGYAFFFEYATGLACFNHNSIPNSPSVHYPYVCEGYTVGIKKYGNEVETTLLYPNPFENVLMLNCAWEVLQVTDVCGLSVKHVVKRDGRGHQELYLCDNAKGIYFITLRGDEGTITIKAMKQ